MDFALSPRSASYLDRVQDFIRARIDPVEAEYVKATANQGIDHRQWRVPPQVAPLQAAAREAGLWNLFLSDELGAGLSTLDYAPLAEAMGRSALAAVVFNCAAPDAGNIDLLLHYGSAAQQRRWMFPLLSGEIRSAFCMTEPNVASSDATNLTATASLEGDQVVLNGRKWWSTGVGHPDCAVLIFMGVTNPDAARHARHSMVLVPRDSPGVTIERMLPTMGLYDAPGGHGEVSFTDVRLPADSIITGPGRGFEIAQSRLGPGRIHHCMRLIGLAERALQLACERGLSRVAFGRPIIDLGGNRERIADARIAIQQARLLVQHAAWLLDTVGLPGAVSAVSQIKVAVPSMAQQVLDLAIQLHGGAGLADDLPLASAWATARAIRLADGPDEVHRGVVARLELQPYR